MSSVFEESEKIQGTWGNSSDLFWSFWWWL